MMLFTHGNDDDEVSTILLDQKIIALKVDAVRCSTAQSLVGLAEKARNNMCDKSTYWPCKVCTVVVVQTIINPTKHFSILITNDDSPRLRINRVQKIDDL